jgi:peptidoglycan/LPS O-acetylase OafA/YrhL
MKKEIKSITGIRGIAALYVAYYHFLEPFNNKNFGDFTPIIKHGYNSVDLFFILSGFVMSLSSGNLFNNGVNKNNYKLFMNRRIARIYPIYLVITLISFVLIYKFKGFKVLAINLLLLQVILNVNNIVGPSWSLSAEWIAYLLFPFLIVLLLGIKNNIWNLVFILLGFSLLVFVSQNDGNFMNGFQHVLPRNGSLDRSIGFSCLVRCLSEYLIGIITFKLYLKYKLKYSKYYHFASLPVFLLIILFLFNPDSDVILVFLFAIFIFSLSTDTGILAKFLGSPPIFILGEISYSLYLIHAILVKTDEFVLKKYLTHSIKYLEVMNGFVFGILLIIISFLSYKYIEMPSRIFLRNKLNLANAKS